MLGHKTVSINLRKLESYQASSLTIVVMKVEINYKKETEKQQNT